MDKMNYCYCYLPSLEFIYTPERVEASSVKDKMVVEFSKQPSSWKVIMERIIGDVVISQVGALLYVVASKAENCVN